MGTDNRSFKNSFPINNKVNIYWHQINNDIVQWCKHDKRKDACIELNNLYEVCLIYMTLSSSDTLDVSSSISAKKASKTKATTCIVRSRTMWSQHLISNCNMIKFWHKTSPSSAKAFFLHQNGFRNEAWFKDKNSIDKDTFIVLIYMNFKSGAMLNT